MNSKHNRKPPWGSSTCGYEKLEMALGEETKRELATKQDLRELELRLQAELAKMKNDLTVRMGALLAATIGTIAALKLFG